MRISRNRGFSCRESNNGGIIGQMQVNEDIFLQICRASELSFRNLG
jgi:hypothetical protein